MKWLKRLFRDTDVSIIGRAKPEEPGTKAQLQGVASDTPGAAPQVFVYDVHGDSGGETVYYLSPLPPHLGFGKGLPPEAIMGQLRQGPEDFSPAGFAPNEPFTRFLHAVIAKHAASCPGLMAEARRQHNGFVYILDLRTPTPNDAVPPEDIIGAVEVRDGQLGHFQGSPNYRIVAQNGLMTLDPWFHAKLMEELLAVVVHPGAQPDCPEGR